MTSRLVRVGLTLLAMAAWACGPVVESEGEDGGSSNTSSSSSSGHVGVSSSHGTATSTTTATSHAGTSSSGGTSSGGATSGGGTSSGGATSGTTASSYRPSSSSAGTTSSSLPGVCAGPHKSLPPAQPPIVNGTRTPTQVSLSALQQNAVVALVYRGSAGTNAFCSGTLIGNQYVLTAVHCTQSVNSQASAIDVAIGQDETSPTAQLHVSQISEHSSQDIAVLKLATPVSASVAEPVPVIERDLTNADVGTLVEDAGFGLTNVNTQAQNGRFFVVETLFTLATNPLGDWSGLNVLGVDGHNQRGVCNGDSGGPSFMTTADGVRVLGALHGGSANCMGQDYYTRADKVRTWIYGIIGTPQTGCGTITAAGQCESNNTVAAYCANNAVRRDTCSGTQHCAYDNTASGYRCVANASDPCQGVTAFGKCTGQTLTWCANNQLLTRPCDQCGEHCALVDGTAGYNCVAGSSSGGSNAAGQGVTCQTATDCPSPSECFGDQGWDTGFCSAPCTDDSQCAWNGVGVGVCLWITVSGATAADHCGVVCTDAGACPTGFECDTSQGTPGACLPVQGGSSSSSSGGTSSSGGGSNADMGLVCTQENLCPGGSACLTYSEGSTTGMCSPVCTSDGDCTFGGPGTGACLWSIPNDANTYCGVLCSDARECPSGYGPSDLPTQSGGTVCVCVTP